MSAASSWMMSEADPPTKLVNSLSWTALTSTGTTDTWLAGWLLFHAAPMRFVPLTVVGCQTYVASLMSTTLRRLLPAWAAPAARATHSATAVQSPRIFFIEGPPFIG